MLIRISVEEAIVSVLGNYGPLTLDQIYCVVNNGCKCGARVSQNIIKKVLEEMGGKGKTCYKGLRYHLLQ
jgi:hypothetical protein